jgi:hypothetical protein
VRGPRRGKDCPGGCGREDVPPHLVACRSCWRQLPKAMRNTVWNTYYSGDREGHLSALVDVMEWYRTHPLESR